MRRARHSEQIFRVAATSEQPPATPPLKEATTPRGQSRTPVSTPTAVHRPIPSPAGCRYQSSPDATAAGPSKDGIPYYLTSTTLRPVTKQSPVPSLSTVTQLPPPPPWQTTTALSGPADLLESIHNLQELRHAIREERVQALQRLQELDARVVAAESKIRQHILEQHASPRPAPAPAAARHGSVTSSAMLSPPPSAVDSRRSHSVARSTSSVPVDQEVEMSEDEDEEDELVEPMDNIRLASAEPSARHPDPKPPYQPHTPSTLSVFTFTPNGGASTSLHPTVVRRPSVRDSGSVSPAHFHASAPHQHSHRTWLPRIDDEDRASKSIVEDTSRAQHGNASDDTSSMELLYPDPSPRQPTKPLRSTTPMSVTSSASTRVAHKRHGESESESDEPLSKTLRPKVVRKRPKLSPPALSASAPAAAPARPPGIPSTATLAFIDVAPNTIKRRPLTAKRASRTGKIACDHRGPPDEPPCPMRFTRYADMVRHRESIHGAAAGRFRCPVCGKSLSRADAVKRHILGAADYVHAQFVASRGREMDGGGDWWRAASTWETLPAASAGDAGSVVEDDGDTAEAPPMEA